MPPDLAMATSAGWAWALVILGALKLGRLSAHRQSLDYGHLEVCLIDFLSALLSFAHETLFMHQAMCSRSDWRHMLMRCSSFMALFTKQRLQNMHQPRGIQILQMDEALSLSWHAIELWRTADDFESLKDSAIFCLLSDFIYQCPESLEMPAEGDGQGVAGRQGIVAAQAGA